MTRERESNEVSMNPSRNDPDPEEGLMFKSPPAGRYVVRPRWRLISTVQVRVGVSHISVAEGNCVTARWGGKQPEANPWSVG
jgi:hypothetical protein